jgi:hypothetical protein
MASGTTFGTRILALATAVLLSLAGPVRADDLDDVIARGELRHLGIRYANFVTGASAIPSFILPQMCLRTPCAPA